MSKKEIFVFDVDGVLLDSTDECLVVAWNAYLDYTNSNEKKIVNPEEADSDYAKHFRSIRNYVRGMDEYLIVFRSKEGEIYSQESFENALKNLESNESQLYGDCFFNARKTLKELDKARWLSLHSIYDGVIELFKKIEKEYNLYIVTGKDKDSVIDFLKYFNIDFQENKIYDKNIAKNKLLALEEIANNEQVANKNIIFLDDNVTHLLEPHKKGFKVLLASWGYGQKEHFDLAKKNSISIFDISTIYKRYLNGIN